MRLFKSPWIPCCFVAGYQHSAHMQCHPDCAGLSEAHQSQEADREGAGGIWHPAQQTAAWHNLQKEGQGRGQSDHDHF